jgi:hypothetical protein
MEINIVDGIVNIRFIMVGLRAGKWSEDSGGIYICMYTSSGHTKKMLLYVQVYYGQIKGRQVVGGQWKNII